MITSVSIVHSFQTHGKFRNNQIYLAILTSLALISVCCHHYKKKASVQTVTA